MKNKSGRSKGVECNNSSKTNSYKTENVSMNLESETTKSHMIPVNRNCT